MFNCFLVKVTQKMKNARKMIISAHPEEFSGNHRVNMLRQSKANIYLFVSYFLSFVQIQNFLSEKKFVFRLQLLRTA